MSRRLSLFCAASIAATFSQAAVAEVRISGTLPDEVSSVASDFQIAPNGRTVVFQVTPYGRQPFEEISDLPSFLYSTPIEGGPLVQLNSASPAGVWIGVPQFTPDSERVVYLAEELQRGTVELFSNSVTGDDHVRLSVPLAEGGNVSGGPSLLYVGFPPPQITPDGSRVIYTADPNADSLFDVYSVPVAGGESLRLSGELAKQGYLFLRPVWLSASDRRVVYSGIDAESRRSDLFSTPWDGGETKLLTPPIPDGRGGTIDLTVPAGPSHHVDEAFALSSNRIAFPAAVYDSGSLESASYAIATLAAGDEAASLVAKAPAYVGLDENLRVRDTDGAVFYSLYGSYAEGDSVFRATFTDDGEPQLSTLGGFDYSRMLLSPDGARLIINAYRDVFSIAADGAESTLLASSDVDGEYQNVYAFDVTPDSQRVLLVRSMGALGSKEFLSAPVTGGISVSLAEASLVFRGVGPKYYVQTTPDSRELIFRAPDEAGTYELSTVPISGGPRIRINDDLVDGGNVGSFKISEDGSTVVYLADQRADDVYELFSVPIRLHWNETNGGQWGTVGSWADASGQSTEFLPERATTVFIDDTPEPVRVVRYEGNGGYVEVASLLVGTQTPEFGLANMEVDMRVFEVAREIEIGERGRLGIDGHTVRVGDSIVNRGVLDVPFGRNPRISAQSVRNESSGSMLVSDSARLRLDAPLVNEGRITMAPTAELIVKESYEGLGTLGQGAVTIEGTLRPGIGIGEAHFGGNLTLASSTGPSLVVELAGVHGPRKHDAVLVDGAPEIGGGLEVQLAALDDGPFEPQPGDVFTILSSAESVRGRFTHVLPPSPDWAIHYDDASVHLEVLEPAGRGDYNGDGRIDQADLDLVLLQGWGETPSTLQPLHAAWTDYLPVGPIDEPELDAVLLGWGRTHGSAESHAASVASLTIPEPASFFLACITSAALLVRRSRSPNQRRVPAQ